MSDLSSMLKAFILQVDPLTRERFGNKSTLGKETTYFVSDGTGSKILNIPMNDYIKGLDTPENAVTVDEISENNSGEENARRIQKIIDAVYENGGGTVCIPKGKFSVSTIRLKSGVTLFIPFGAELISLTYEENLISKEPLERAIISADGCENICVTGGGTINGCALSYTLDAEDSSPCYALEYFNLYLRVMAARKRIRQPKSDSTRCNIINFRNCKGVNIENICLKDSAFWTLALHSCDDVKIKNVVIDDNMHIANTDGIDICGGSDVLIEHCFIASGDDAIVLKPIESPVKNLKVRDCIISSYANCFKIGTETVFDVYDIEVRDCLFFLPDGITQGYSGIAIESCDGANIKNVTVSDIKMFGVSSVFLIWLGNRLKYNKNSVGSIEDITIRNIKAENTELPCAITGCTEKGKTHYVKNVKLCNIEASYRDTKERLRVKKKTDEYALTGYPEITRVSHIYFKSHRNSQYWDLPCYGLCLRHTENISYEGLSVKKRSCSKLGFLHSDDTK